MLTKVKKFVEKWNMLTTKDRVIVGVSGGADSICLLFVLLELQKHMGFDLVAVHVNHGLRGAESDGDEAYVKQFCEERGVPLKCYFANVELIAKNRKQSTEEAGREVRREFFWQALKECGGTKIALAHHQDDQAETFFLHIARGTGLKGLGGIRPVNAEMIRPLLCVRREEIEAYLKKEHIVYRTDGTNSTDAYTRNRIRNHVIPYFEKEINTRAVLHLNETMEQLRAIQDLLEELTAEAWKACVLITEDEVHVLEEAYLQLSPAIQSHLLKKVMAEVAGREKDLESVHIDNVQELFLKQCGRKLDLPYGIEAVRTYAGISLYYPQNPQQKNDEILVYDMQESPKVFQTNGMTITCTVIDTKNIQKSHTNWFDCDIIENNLCFRTRRPGDYITIHPDGRTQKLKTFFINEKISQRKRDKILLVADGSHVLWVVGYRRGNACVVTENTKRILEVQIYGGEKDGREN